MKILNYGGFILESKFRGFNSLGEYVEDLCTNDEYINMFVGRKIDVVDSTISISNAVNTLDEVSKKELLNRIDIYLNGEELDKYPVISSHTEIVSESFGKNIFTTFLKCLTALGLKENDQDLNDVPNDFIFIFKFKNLDSNRVRGVFSRFKSFSDNKILDNTKTVGLYFGLKTDSNFEYGFIDNDVLTQIGFFTLNKINTNSILGSELKSSFKLKKILSTFSIKEIKLISDIKNSLNSYNPGYFSKKTCVYYSDRIIGISFYGIGKWDNGVLDQGELDNFKNNFKNYLIKYKWSDKVLVSISSNDFWINIKVKMK